MTRKHYLAADIKPALVTALTSAKTSIKLATGWISEPSILGLLQKQALAGVQVELILYGHDESRETLFGGQTSTEGVHLIRVGDRLKEQLIDAKFGLVDEGKVIIEGDYSWQKGPAEEGRTLILSANAATLAKTYQQEFEYLRLDGLHDFTDDPDVAAIVEKIEDEDFVGAALAVSSFLEDHQIALACVNPPIDNLLHEIQQLEQQVSDVSQEVADTQKRMTAFSKLHGEKLGDLLEGILFETKIKAKRLADNDPAQQDFYEEAASDHEKYTNSQEAARKNKTKTLDAREQKELKKLYRKASMKCHPDRVVDDLHDQAQEIFLELNEAYKNNDLERVRAISEELSNNRMADKSEVLTERKKLESTRKSLLGKLAEWNAQLEALLSQPNSKIINAIDDWDDYFEETRMLLEDQLFRLRTENKTEKLQAEKPTYSPTSGK